MLARVFVTVICCVWGLGAQGATGGWLGGLRGPRILQGPNTNEACSSLMEQIQEKQTCDVVPSGGPESLPERNKTLVECVCVCVCVVSNSAVMRRDKKEMMLLSLLLV